MGRFQAEETIVRELRDIEIVFWDSQSIYVYERRSGRWVIFHRWFAPRGSYGEYWGDFRRKMLRYRGLDMAGCRRLAERYGVEVAGTDRPVKLEGRKVIYRK